MADKRTHVFISYAKEDSEKVKVLNDELKKHGIITWIDYERLNIGERWESSINKAIRESRAFIFLSSSSSINKTGFVQRELKKAIYKINEYPVDKIVLLIVRLDDTEPLDEVLSEFQWVNWFEGNPPITQLVISLKLNNINELENKGEQEKQEDIKRMKSGEAFRPDPTAIGTLFNSPDDFDIFCDKSDDLVYIFHGPDISKYSVDHLEYHLNDHWVTVILSDGQRLNLGAKIQWLIRPYWEEAEYLFIIRTENGEAIDGIEIKKINIGKQVKTIGLKRNVTSKRSIIGFNYLRGWIQDKLKK